MSQEEKGCDSPFESAVSQTRSSQDQTAATTTTPTTTTATIATAATTIVAIILSPATYSPTAIQAIDCPHLLPRNRAWVIL